MAQDSYSGKVYLALLMGKAMEELMSVWVSRVQVEVTEDKETWGGHVNEFDVDSGIQLSN